jgi:hypothetical protein
MRELESDLAAGCAPTRDQHASCGYLPRIAVRVGSDLHDVCRQARRKLRNHTALECAGGHDDRAARNMATATRARNEVIRSTLEANDAFTHRSWKIQCLRVPLQVIGNLVLVGVSLGMAVQRQAGQAVVSARAEEHEGIVAVPP